MPNIRKSNSDHIRDGTYRADRHAAKQALQVEAPLPNPPAWISDTARTEWFRATDAMRDAGIFRATDWTILATYCELYAEIQTVGIPGTPASRIALFRQLCNDLGLSPNARAKFDASAPKGAAPGHDRADFSNI